MKMTESELQIKQNLLTLLNQFREKFKEAKWLFDASRGFNPFREGIDFWRQNQSDIKVDLCTARVTNS